MGFVCITELQRCTRVRFDELDPAVPPLRGTTHAHAPHAPHARTACANDDVATVVVFLACSQTLAVIGTHTLPERPLSIAAQQTADPASLAFAMGTESGRVYRVVL